MSNPEADLMRRERIMQIIQKVAGRDISPRPDESLFKSGLVGSFALLDMLALLDSEMGVQTPDDDINPNTFDSGALIKAFLDRTAP